MSQIGQYQNSNMIVSAVNFLEGNTGGQVPPDLLDTIYLIGTDGISVSGNAGTSTLTLSFSGGGAFLDTLTGNTGGPISPTGGNINVLTANSNIIFAGSGSTETLDFGASSNILLGSSGSSISSAARNTALGQLSLEDVSTGIENVAIGWSALNNISTGSNNVAVGNIAGLQIFTGSNNIAIGNQSVFDESGVIRIGTNPLQTKTFITGINGINVGSIATVVTSAAGDQLGTAVITAGSGITIVPTANAITISTSGITPAAYTNVSTSPYVVLITDEYISVNASSIAITIELPDIAALSRVFIIKDRLGFASTNNITITTVSGATNIDGATSFVMNSAFQSIQIIGNGSSYEIY